jgi:hypothetical protein
MQVGFHIKYEIFFSLKNGSHLMVEKLPCKIANVKKKTFIGCLFFYIITEVLKR